MATKYSGKNSLKKTIKISMLLLASIAMLMGTAFSFVLQTNNGNQGSVFLPTTVDVLEYSCTFSTPNRTLNNQNVSFTIDGLPLVGNAGEPWYPQKTIRVLLPEDKEISSITIRTEGQVSLPAELYQTYHITIAQEIQPLSSGQCLEYKQLNTDLYGKTFPDYFYYDQTTQYKYGYKIAHISVYPLHFSFDAKGSIDDIQYVQSLTLTLHLSESPHALPARRARSVEHDHSRITSIVDDHPSISSVFSTYSQLKYPIQTNSRQSLVNADDTYEYVIITNQALRDSQGDYTFQDLVQSKIDKGLTARIVTVEEISACPEYWWSGIYGDGNEIYNDTPCHIRNFIKDAWTNWETEYVLLGGDGDSADVGGESEYPIVPARFLKNTIGSDSDIPSDMYYCCLDGTFDSDGDGIFGEINDGFDIDPIHGYVDLYAEVYIGRAPVDSEEELSNFIRKTLHYEQSNGEEYLRNSTMVGEHLGYMGDAEYGDYSKEEIRTGSTKYGYETVGIPSLYDVTTLYDSMWEENGWDQPNQGSGGWPNTNILSIINNGVHIINHLGHGNNQHIFKLNSPDDLQGLTNTNSFFAYSQACYAGNFANQYPDGSSLEYDSIIEHLITDTHGAFAFVGNTNYGLAMPFTTNGPSQHFDREFFDALFSPLESCRTLGEANEDSKEDTYCMITSASNETYLYCFYEITLFGDPEQSIQTPPLRDHDVGINRIFAPDYHFLEDGALLVVPLVENLGSNDESNLIVNLYVNDVLTDTSTISFIPSLGTAGVGFYWSAEHEGRYTITIEVEAVPDEIYLLNNRLNKTVHILGDSSVLICVLDGLMSDYGSFVFDYFNNNYEQYGDIPIYIDYTTLNKDDITYQDLVESRADVLLIHSSFPTELAEWEFTQNEFEAIRDYANEGHQLIVAYKSFGGRNDWLKSLTGLQNNLDFFQGYAVTPSVEKTVTGHPIFSNLPDDFSLSCASQEPIDFSWDNADLLPEAVYLGRAQDVYFEHVGHTGSIVCTLNNNVYISWILEFCNEFNNSQLFYNALVFAHDSNVFYAFPKETKVGIVNMTQQFYGYTCGGVPPYDWLWDFGTGDYLTGQTPSYMYQQCGTYPVSYSSQDTLDHSQTSVFTITIKEVYAISNGPYEGFANESVKFKSSYLCNGTIVSRYWDFGDGTGSSSAHPTHIYSAPGNYTVTFTVTDSHGHSDCATTWAIVYEPLVVEIEGPEGCYYGEDYHGHKSYYCIIGEEYRFNGTASGGFPPYTWQWSVGSDVAGSKNTQNATLVFLCYAAYAISLNVLDSRFVNRQSELIVVYSRYPLVADTHGPYTAKPNQDISFTGSASGGHEPYYDSWLWDFGDGNVSTLQCTTHSYSNDGNYTVTLTVTDNEGISDTETTTATVEGEAPSLSITTPKSGGFYYKDRLIFNRIFSDIPIIFGTCTVTVEAEDSESNISHVDFYIDDELRLSDTSLPYQYVWEKETPVIPFQHHLRVVAYDSSGNFASQERIVRKFW